MNGRNLYIGILLLLVSIVSVVSVLLFYSYGQKQKDNKTDIIEGFDLQQDRQQEQSFLQSEEAYYKKRLGGPYVPGQEQAEKFIQFNPEKPIGKQLSPILEEQQRQEESNVDNNVERCSKITSCDELDGTSCGYCFFTNKFYYGNENGPLTEVCPGGWVKTKEQCVERRERSICEKVTSCREMVGEAEICGWCPTKNKAFVAMKDGNGKLVPKYKTDVCQDEDILTNQDLGLVAGKDCAEFEKDHPCIGTNENTGPHSVQCLSKLWQSSGCSSRGTINPAKAGANNSWWNQRGWEDVLRDMKLWKTDADSGNWNVAKQHHEGCYGTPPDPCDPKYNPRPTECLQQLYLESGCNEKGELYKELANNTQLKTMSKNDLQKYFKTLVENTRSSDYKTRADANIKCYGVQITAPPPLKVGDKVKLTRQVGSGKTSVCADTTANDTIEFEGYICKDIGNDRVEVLWTSMTNPNVSERCKGKQNVWNRSAYIDNQKWIAEYLGYCGVAPSYFADTVSSQINRGDLTLLETCSNSQGCSSSGCAMQLILAVSYPPRVSYNVEKSQIADVVMKVREKYPGAQIANYSDLQYLVDIGVPYCFCGWTERDGDYISVHPSTEQTGTGCGSGYRRLNVCSWTNKSGVYIRVSANPDTVVNTLKESGLVGAVVAIVGKNEYISLTTSGVVVNEPENPRNYVMYGRYIDRGNGIIPIQRIEEENNGNTLVYITQDGRYTKIVKDTNGDQEGYYYVGVVSEYGKKPLIEQPKGVYNVRRK